MKLTLHHDLSQRYLQRLFEKGGSGRDRANKSTPYLGGGVGDASMGKAWKEHG